MCVRILFWLISSTLALMCLIDPMVDKYDNNNVINKSFMTISRRQIQAYDRVTEKFALQQKDAISQVVAINRAASVTVI